MTERPQERLSVQRPSEVRADDHWFGSVSKQIVQKITGQVVQFPSAGRSKLKGNKHGLTFPNRIDGVDYGRLGSIRQLSVGWGNHIQRIGEERRNEKHQ